MTTFPSLTSSFSSEETRSFLIGAGTALALSAAWRLTTRRDPKIIRAPRPTAANHSFYPSDFYPGGKNIDTPYGSIRTYEFGPEDGKRLLFVHGITTPSPVFAGILPAMADAGYRVCTFDLFGRGYSDSPDLPHDERLYTSQILCVLQNLGWTKVSLIGYSLGGGLVSAFASYFPTSVDQLILIAPAGLLDGKNLPFSRRFAKSEYISYHLLNTFRKVIAPKPNEISKDIAGDRVDVSHVTQWQDAFHEGFPRSCMKTTDPISGTLLTSVDLSSFRYAPIFDQWELFERLRSHNLKIEVIWGDKDVIVDYDVVSKNVQKALPGTKIRVFDGVAHDICTASPRKLVTELRNILES